MRALANSPSSGVNEVLAALRRARGFPPRGSASDVTGTVNDSNAILWIAQGENVDADSVSVAIIVAGLGTALSVDVSGTDVTVHSATDALTGDATSTAGDVIAAVTGSGAASALVIVDNSGESDGTGVVAAVSKTLFTGASRGRYVGAALLKRYLPVRVPLSQITTILDGLVGTYVAKSSGNYALTADGAVYARGNRPRRYPIWIT